MSRTVVFGGSGFIGSAMRRGLADVVAPTRSEVDLADAASVRRFLRPGDRIVNAAGYAAATDRSPAGVARLRRDNVDAVAGLAQGAADVGVDRLVHVSSVAAMGHRDGAKLTEVDMTEPRSPYGRSKRDAERALTGFRGRLRLTVLRPTSVFGEGRPLAVLLCRIARLPLVPLPAGGRAMIPFTYVGNVVAATRAALESDATVGGTYIVGDDDSYTLRSIVDGLAQGMGRSRIVTVPIPSALLHGAAHIERGLRPAGRPPIFDPTRIDTLTRSISYSIDAFRTATGYEPPVSMSDATARIGAWYGVTRP
jgi:nucleoside-diphosphate-sugar epimerase